MPAPRPPTELDFLLSQPLDTLDGDPLRLFDPSSMSTSSIPVDQALAEAEAARNRLRFLLEASTVLGSSLDFDDSLTRLARLVAATMADV
ncbi:MAG TPA: hypothetical protein VNN79_18150, partial [Actinomycetota bacterium]|nr:hypothetical protein [Actinomycetota bacterium]